MSPAKIQKLFNTAFVLLLVATPETLLWASELQTAKNQEASQTEWQLLGVWTGDSICQVKSSPCHDEKAIYRISKSKEAGKLTIDLGKIVEGKAESMTVLDFTYDPIKHTLICEQKYGVWELVIRGDKMEGTLTTSDKVIYRRMSLKKEQ